MCKWRRLASNRGLRSEPRPLPEISAVCWSPDPPLAAAGASQGGRDLGSPLVSACWGGEGKAFLWVPLDRPLGFPGGTNRKEPTCQHRRHKRSRFDPWAETTLWRRAWQPTPVFLPGESHGQRSLAGYSPWGCRVGHDRSNLACMHALVPYLLPWQAPSFSDSSARFPQSSSISFLESFHILQKVAAAVQRAPPCPPPPRPHPKPLESKLLMWYPINPRYFGSDKTKSVSASPQAPSSESILDFTLNQALVLWQLANGDFLILPFPSNGSISNPNIRKSFLLSQLVTHYVWTQCGLMDSHCV